MANPSPLPREELLRQVKKLLSDPERGISITLFAELCGISDTHLRRVFLDEVDPMTETTQIRVNKGYADWKSGRVKIMKRPDNTRYVDFRREPIPPLKPKICLHRTAEGIKIRVGPVNRHDYSQPDLDEALRG